MAETELTNLPVLECTQAPVISENLLDVGAEIQTQLAYLESLPKTRESEAEVKKLRAEYNKKFAAAEEGRKETKKARLAPYEKAERLYNSFVKQPFSTLDAACKAFVEEVENAEKAECEEALKEYFAELCAMRGIHWLSWEWLGFKVDLATARMKEPKKAMEAIKAKVDKVCSDLDTITHMGNSTEYLAEYESCLDVSEAIRRVNARREAQRIAEAHRAEREARQAQAAVTRQAMPEVGTVVVPQQEKKFRVTFTVTATMPMLRGLKAWLEDKKIEYQEVT